MILLFCLCVVVDAFFGIVVYERIVFLYTTHIRTYAHEMKRKKNTTTTTLISFNLKYDTHFFTILFLLSDFLIVTIFGLPPFEFDWMIKLFQNCLTSQLEIVMKKKVEIQTDRIATERKRSYVCVWASERARNWDWGRTNQLYSEKEIPSLQTYHWTLCARLDTPIELFWHSICWLPLN